MAASRTEALIPKAIRTVFSLNSTDPRSYKRNKQLYTLSATLPLSFSPLPTPSTHPLLTWAVKCWIAAIDDRLVALKARWVVVWAGLEDILANPDTWTQAT